MARPFPIHNITDDSALGGSVIERSLRFDDGDSAHLNRTPSSAGNRRTWTWSAWVKRSETSSTQGRLFGGGVTSSDYFEIYFASGDELRVIWYEGGQTFTTATPAFRDSNSWYHFVVAVDTTQAVGGNRILIYANGVLLGRLQNDPAQNFETSVNSTVEHNIGNYLGGSAAYFDGYMAEINFVDGLQLNASYFGYTDFQTGLWRPKGYSGSYGTNGFRLDFSDNSAATAVTLGKDRSGQDNNFTPNNLVVSDSVLDTPSNTFATLNALILSPDVAFKQGNLYFDTPNAHKSTYCNFGVHTGKWYWEAKCIAGSTTKWTYGVSDMRNCVGKQTSGQNYLLAHTSGDSALTYAHGDVVAIYNRHIYKNGSQTDDNYQVEPSAGDIIGIALDVDAGKIWFASNGTWINGSASASTTLNESSHDKTVATGQVYTPAFSGELADWQVNFGQDSSYSGTSTAQGNKDGSGLGDFYYTVPSGFKALCSNNLPPTVPSINPKKHFNTVIYTGNNAEYRHIPLDFKADLLWFKHRNGTTPHTLSDSVSGITKHLTPNATSAQSTPSYPYVSSVQDDGIILRGSTNSGGNISGRDMVAWCWKAGGNSNTFNVDGVGYASASAAGITDGTVALTGASVNRKAGFSIVTYSGNNASSTTFGHGLSQAPEIYILKSRVNTEEWRVYYTVVDGSYDFMYLNTTDDVFTSGYALPTSTLINKADDNGENMVAYCWHSVPGYSKIGSYTGNGDANGPFVYTGFRPAFVMMKEHTDSSTNWVIYDNMRGVNTYNPVDLSLYPNLTNAEGDASLDYDFVSNGFKIRTSNGGINANSDKYLYMAFAEQSGDTPYQTEPNAR